MAGSNEITLKEALKLFLNHYKYNDRINQIRLQEVWFKSMGSMINKHTKRISLNNKVLTVELDSAALKNELSFAKEKMKDTLNTFFDDVAINEIRIK
ncbi:MAG: DUF721 domain-containing protein [Bacteroidales bacterium]|nr:DUF721 domain-containing protein [Bacteroidales bacterium]